MSAESTVETGDRCATENERVRKRLKSKRRDWEKRERKCRRADIFAGVHPHYFCVSRGKIRVASEPRVWRGNKRFGGEATWGVETHGVEARTCPREHKSLSYII